MHPCRRPLKRGRPETLPEGDRELQQAIAASLGIAAEDPAAAEHQDCGPQLCTLPCDSPTWTDVVPVLEHATCGEINTPSAVCAMLEQVGATLHTSVAIDTSGLLNFLQNELPLHAELQLGQLVAFIAQQALKVDQVPQFPLLKRGVIGELQLTQDHCCCLLACSFLCLFRNRPRGFPEVNFFGLYTAMHEKPQGVVNAKLHCLICYFHQRSLSNANMTKVVFERRKIRPFALDQILMLQAPLLHVEVRSGIYKDSADVYGTDEVNACSIIDGLISCFLTCRVDSVGGLCKCLPRWWRARLRMCTRRN